MKKIKQTLAILLFLAVRHSAAQNHINGELPNIIPPSPTSAGLMKFEEVPISYYTGLPSIEIPFHILKLKNGIDMPIKLSYHPANAKIDEVASDCGLGWSLIAGGSISRTVKGYPDEILIRDGSRTGKVGIYQTSTPLHINRFYEFSNMVENQTVDYRSYNVNEYLWDINIKGKYDTEHDMYQYNFLGYTGRFIIKKENGILKVSKLDVNPLKIINSYDSDTFVPNSFTILDDEGNRYIFDIIEITESQPVVSTVPRSMNSNPGFSSDPYTFRSSFHLSKIYDRNNILQIELNYSLSESIEKTKSGVTTTYVDKYGQIPQYESYYGSLSGATFNPLPIEESSSTINLTRTKKISSIALPNGEIASFIFSRGRNDSNLIEPSNSYILSQVDIKGRNGAIEKKIKFFHTYSLDNKTRMVLDKVWEYGNGNTYLERKLTYGIIFAQIRDGSAAPNPPFGELNPTSYGGKMTANVLQRMTLPTGGYINYDFGPSTYSYIGNSSIPEQQFDEDWDNWLFRVDWVGYNGLHTTPMKPFFSIMDDQQVQFHTANTFSPNITNYNFNIYKKNISGGHITYDKVANLTQFPADGVPLADMGGTYTLTAGEYYVDFNTGSRDPADAPYIVRPTIGAYTKKWKRLNPDGTRIYTSRQLHGYDVKINAIEYFDGQTSKKESYSYNFHNQPGRSSGSLAYAPPVYKSVKTKRECVSVPSHMGGQYGRGDFYITYDVITTANQLSFVKTKGYDVGYQNVAIFKSEDAENQVGVGVVPFVARRMTFTSPINYPEEIDSYLNTSYPFLPTLNIDYKRGLLKKESYYNGYDLKVKEMIYDYSFEDHISNNGLRFYNGGQGSFVMYNESRRTFAQYNNILNNGHCLPDDPIPPVAIDCYCNFGRPTTFVQYKPIKEAFGWAKLEKVTTSEYFDNGSPLETETLYTYKPYNQKVETQTQKLSDGRVAKTNYFYAGDESTWDMPEAVVLNSKNAVSALLKTENYIDGEKTSEQQVNYKSWGNGLIQPETVQQSKGGGDLENRFRYTAIDIVGNPKEVQKEKGTKTCYIWGYGKTLPIAKIENCPGFDVIDSGKVAAAEVASDSQNYSEPVLLAALKALRTDASLENAMVTTYTYSRLAAVSTVTDPKGDMTQYSYDSFGNLEYVLDKNGNILSENKYHYQNQH